MFDTLTKMLTGLYDEILAPADTFGAHVDSAELISGSDTSLMSPHFATDLEVTWSNDFGTANDFEVPASSSPTCFDDPFSTF